jgi:hypothetical protein
MTDPVEVMPASPERLSTAGSRSTRTSGNSSKTANDHGKDKDGKGTWAEGDYAYEYVQLAQVGNELRLTSTPFTTQSTSRRPGPRPFYLHRLCYDITWVWC